MIKEQCANCTFNCNGAATKNYRFVLDGENIETKHSGKKIVAVWKDV